MSRRRHLQRIVELTAEQANEAAKVMAEAMREIEQAEAQLEAMHRFRRDYSERQQQSEYAMNAMRFQEYRAFLSKLGKAIEDQESVLQGLRQDYAAIQLAWQQAHCRNKGVSKIQKKLAQQENYRLERRIQSEQDDRAAVRRRKKPIQ